MKSYCRVHNQYILVGRLLNSNTLQIIQDTKIVEMSIPTTDLQGDVVCTYIKENNEITNLVLYPITSDFQLISTDTVQIIIVPQKEIQTIHTDITGQIILKHPSCWVELQKYCSDFYHVFVITSVRKNLDKNIDIYTAKQIY